MVTAVAPVFIGIFDKDVNPMNSKKIYDNMPYLYEETRKQNVFTVWTFVKWFMLGTFHSLLIYFGTIYAYTDGTLTNDGMEPDLWSTSVCAFFSTVFVVWGVLFMDTKEYTILTFFGYFVLSVLVFFPGFYFWWSVTFESLISDRHNDYIGNWKFWLTIIIITSIVLII